MNKNKSSHNQKSRGRMGFSLIEILIVIALIGTLAGLMIANLDKFFGAGKEDAARIFVNQSMEAPMQLYSIHMNGYPTTAEGLNALMKAPSSAGSRWRGPYLKEDPVDPWGSDYQYKAPGTQSGKPYDLWSMGPDKKNGGGDDIGNW